MSDGGDDIEAWDSGAGVFVGEKVVSKGVEGIPPGGEPENIVAYPVEVGGISPEPIVRDPVGIGGITSEPIVGDPVGGRISPG